MQLKVQLNSLCAGEVAHQFLKEAQELECPVVVGKRHTKLHIKHMELHLTHISFKHSKPVSLLFTASEPASSFH